MCFSGYCWYDIRIMGIMGFCGVLDRKIKCFVVYEHDIAHKDFHLSFG